MVEGKDFRWEFFSLRVMIYGLLGEKFGRWPREKLLVSVMDDVTSWR